jgi:hypothetical protein
VLEMDLEYWARVTGKSARLHLVHGGKRNACCSNNKNVAGVDERMVFRCPACARECCDCAGHGDEEIELCNDCWSNPTWTLPISGWQYPVFRVRGRSYTHAVQGLPRGLQLWRIDGPDSPYWQATCDDDVWVGSLRECCEHLACYIDRNHQR